VTRTEGMFVRAMIRTDGISVRVMSRTEGISVGVIRMLPQPVGLIRHQRAKTATAGAAPKLPRRE
jgi:hypothetical protein